MRLDPASPLEADRCMRRIRVFEEKRNALAKAIPGATLVRA